MTNICTEYCQPRLWVTRLMCACSRYSLTNCRGIPTCSGDKLTSSIQGKISCIAEISLLQELGTVLWSTNSEVKTVLPAWVRSRRALAACRFPRPVDDTLHDDGANTKALISCTCKSISLHVSLFLLGYYLYSVAFIDDQIRRGTRRKRR